MTKLNKFERFTVYFLIAWTLLHIVFWVTAREGYYFQKEQFWPFLQSSDSYTMDLAHTYDFREFIMYTFVPWTLFFIAEHMFKVEKDS